MVRYQGVPWPLKKTIIFRRNWLRILHWDVLRQDGYEKKLFWALLCMEPCWCDNPDWVKEWRFHEQKLRPLDSLLELSIILIWTQSRESRLEESPRASSSDCKRYMLYHRLTFTLCCQQAVSGSLMVAFCLLGLFLESLPMIFRVSRRYATCLWGKFSPARVTHMRSSPSVVSLI